MLLGYNTNGLAHHAPDDALALLSELGYGSVALTIDHGLLNPYSDDIARQVEHVRSRLARYGLRSVIETGARFLLDSRTKHEPTLVTADIASRARRVAFYKSAIDIAAALKSDCVSLWSGVLQAANESRGSALEDVWRRLLPSLSETLTYATERGVQVGFEPEPGMFIDTMEQFAELRHRLNDDTLRLTLDVGHLHCLGETPIDAQILRWGPLMINVHLEDMAAGVHEHLMFGAGEIDFPPVLAALRAVGYEHGVHVELSRHSHDGYQAARRARDFLMPLI